MSVYAASLTMSGNSTLLAGVFTADWIASKADKNV